MWDRRDWHEFFEIARRPWQRHRPPRPVYDNGTRRIMPAMGFSLAELSDAGINVEWAERLSLPVDAGRIGSYGPNVSALREFVRSARKPG
jgi:ribosomal protein L13E